MGVRGLAQIIKKSTSHIAGDLTAYTAHVDTQCLFYNLIRAQAYSIFCKILKKNIAGYGVESSTDEPRNAESVAPRKRRAHASSPAEASTKKQKAEISDTGPTLQHEIESIAYNPNPPRELYLDTKTMTLTKDEPMLVRTLHYFI